MANVQFQNVPVFQRKLLGTIQTAENIRISVKNDIAEVLSVGVDNVINSYESREGEVSFFGKTALKFLYNDGTTVASSTYNADFTASVQNPAITPETKCSFSITTIDSKVETNANTATVTLLLEISAYGYVAQDITYFADCEDAFVQKSGIETLKSADVVTLPVVIDEELCATKTISTVLLAESAICITDYTNVDGMLRVEGDANVRLTYWSEGAVTTDNLPFKFQRELDATGIDSASQLKITPYVRATKVRLNISEDSVNTNFTVEVVANLVVESTVCDVLQVVADAYGTNCDFAFVRKDIQTTLPCGSCFAKKNAEFALLGEGEVLSVVNVGATVTRCESLNGCARVSGYVHGTLLHSTENGIGSKIVEFPFVQDVDIEYLAPQCVSHANVTVTNLVATNNSVKAELSIAVDSYRDVEYSTICQATEKPFDKACLSAIEVCLAHKGETLWQLGKALHLSEEDLLSLNPEITNPLDKDARIVVFNSCCAEDHPA